MQEHVPTRPQPKRKETETLDQQQRQVQREQAESCAVDDQDTEDTLP
jgi:hypothetical protein